MAWNKNHRDGWHPKGSRSSNGGSYARFLVVDAAGQELGKYVYKKAAEQQAETITKVKKEYGFAAVLPLSIIDLN